MLIILFKTTIIWLILLLCYFLLLSREKAAVLNRLLLWLALLSGIIIPFIETPFSYTPEVLSATSQATTPLNVLPQAGSSNTSEAGATAARALDWGTIIFYLWLAGAIAQTFLLLRNAFQLYYLKKFSRKNQHPITDFYSNENTPAAFSFGKLIYLPETEYNAQDLRLILQHEQLHAQHKHWIDNTLIELMQILFWFHPLFYVFKKQIKLVHEYQVDQEIDVADQYDYAKLLLAQNNKAYTNKLIHTFNFSPLKNRIAMMTNSKKVSRWKYVLTLPAIALCFGLMSASPKSDQRIRNGNTTTFRGNTIVWQAGGVDTLEVTDPATGETIIQKIDQNDRVKKVNGHEVAEGIFLSLNMGSAEFANPELEAISKNIQQALTQNRSKFPENISFLQIENIVLDKNLNVYYYDVRTGGVNMTDTTLAGLNKFPGVNKEVDKILKNKKQINPANIVLNKDYYTLQAWTGFRPDQAKVEFIKN